MYRAVLTIDDSPTNITPELVDYLCEKGIVPILNVIGAKMDEYADQVQYAIKKGAILGNHSYMHDEFSKLTIAESRDDIRKTEEKIAQAYERAGVKREHRVFRFPYGDMGNESNKEALQKLLREEFHFERLDSSENPNPYWKENQLDTCVNMHWSFDFIEYQLADQNGFTWESIVNRIHDKAPKMGGVLLDESGINIVLMHDMEETNAVLPGYYKKILEYVIEQGVTFVKPKFLK